MNRFIFICILLLSLIHPVYSNDINKPRSLDRQLLQQIILMSRYNTGDFSNPNRLNNWYEENEKKCFTLLENGANPNIENKDKNTPLLYACYAHRYKLVVFFLKHGANINVMNRYKLTPIIMMMLAHPIYQDHYYRLDTKKRRIYIYHDIKYANVGLMENPIEDIQLLNLLITNGGKINQVDTYGDTALSKAVAGDYINCVKILLDNGADIKWKYGDRNIFDLVRSDKMLILLKSYMNRKR